MVDPPLRVALIGAGQAAQELHAPAVSTHPRSVLAAVCDVDEQRAADLANRFGAARVSTSLSALLAEGGIDAVHILTPTDTHEELAIQALQAGCHVLVEKPFTDNLAAANRIVGAAHTSGRTLSVIHNELATPAVDEATARVQAGEIGDLVTVQYLVGHRDQRFVPDPWYYRTRGGRMGETLPHALCLLVEFLPDLEVTHVDARCLGREILADGILETDRTVDELSVQLSTRDGRATARIWYSFNSFVPTSVLLAGTEGHILLHPFGRVAELSPHLNNVRRDLPALLLNTFSKTSGRFLRRFSGAPSITATSHYRQIADFVEHARRCEPASVTPEKATNVVRLWDAIVDAFPRPPSVCAARTDEHILQQVGPE